MKSIGIMKTAFAAVLVSAIFFAFGCDDPNKNNNIPSVSEKEKLNKAADKVRLDYPDKANITASQAQRAKITAEGYDKTAYTIEYKTVTPNDAMRKLTVVFVLKAAGGAVQSKETTAEITGFKQAANITIAEQDIIDAFGLQKGQIRASNAAKKIKTGNPVNAQYVFTEKEILAYDDKTGTFKIRVKGSKNGSPFEQTLELTGFTHPYAHLPKYPKDVVFNFDEAIDSNLSIDKYIEKINSGNTAEYLNFSFYLEHSTKVIELGNVNDEYALSATVSKHNSDLKITPAFKLKYYKLVEGGTSETAYTEDYASAHSDFYNQKKKYFEKEQVFERIIKKVKNDFVIVSSNKFASEIYAKLKGLGVTPAGVLKTESGIFKQYKDIYAVKDENEHLQLTLDAAVYQPKTSAELKADDYKGSLKLTYCIGETDNIAEPQIGAAVSDEETYTGFDIISAEKIKQELFTFSLIKGTGTNQKENWFKKVLTNVPLLRGEFGSYRVENVLRYPGNNSYYLTINSELDYDGNVLVTDLITGLSKGYSKNQLILVTGIVLNKDAGTGILKVTCSFEGSGAPITVTTGEKIQ